MVNNGKWNFCLRLFAGQRLDSRKNGNAGILNFSLENGRTPSKTLSAAMSSSSESESEAGQFGKIVSLKPFGSTASSYFIGRRFEYADCCRSAPSVGQCSGQCSGSKVPSLIRHVSLCFARSPESGRQFIRSDSSKSFLGRNVRRV